MKDRVRGTMWYGPLKAIQGAVPAQRDLKARRREFYRQFVSERSMCFDVGSNMGNRTEIFLALGATVVAVEPQLMCVRSLKARFPINDRLIVIPMGLDAAPGVATLYECSEHVLSTMSVDVVADPIIATATFASGHEIRVTTLDSLIAVFGLPDFVKIDAEGYEDRILQGLHSAPAALSVEYNPSKLGVLMDCLALIDGLGDYQFRFSPGESMAFSTVWGSAQRILAELPTERFGDVYARRTS